MNLFEKDGAGYLVVHTEKSKGKGEKFALKANLNRCLAKFVHEGKLTIEFKEPSGEIFLHFWSVFGHFLVRTIWSPSLGPASSADSSDVRNSCSDLNTV